MFADCLDLKAAADAAFKAGRLDEAAAFYKEMVLLDPGNALALCNSSAVSLKCGQPEDALTSAERALALLAHQAAQGDTSCLPQLAKAYYRKAQAWLALGSPLTAIKVLRQGLAACKGCQQEILAALRLTVDQLPCSWLAKYWSRLIKDAQAPNPLSSRDGLLLKTIPPERRLLAEELQHQLEGVLEEGWREEACDLMCAAWARGRKPGRPEVAFFRSAAYLRAGHPQLALRDVRLALVYGPQASLVHLSRSAGSSTSSSSQALVPSNKGTKSSSEGAAAVPVEVPCWSAALALQSAVLEAEGDNVPAALSMAKALEFAAPECEAREAYEAALERLLRRIPEACARALQERGSAGLEALLAAEKEERLPEFLRKRPKYYYYYEWMRKRIHEQYPELPEPVMDKLLTMEATELDLILQYPQATQQTVERVLGVYQEQGPEYLETYRVPLLSWEEVKALKGPGTIGLPLGSEACGGLLAGMGMLQEPPPALPEGEEDAVLQITAAPAPNTAPTPSLPPTGSSTPALPAGEGGMADSACISASQQVVPPPSEGGDQGDAWRPGAVAVSAVNAASSHAIPQQQAPGSLSCHRIELDSEDEADGGSEGSMSVDDLEDLYELD
ncbi:hypothetical protein N2152v2_005907 [Parachlorella kessleri]